jgi:hypothetical protein
MLIMGRVGLWEFGEFVGLAAIEPFSVSVMARGKWGFMAFFLSYSVRKDP